MHATDKCVAIFASESLERFRLKGISVQKT